MSGWKLMQIHSCSSTHPFCFRIGTSKVEMVSQHHQVFCSGYDEISLLAWKKDELINIIENSDHQNEVLVQEQGSFRRRKQKRINQMTNNVALFPLTCAQPIVYI